MHTLLSYLFHMLEKDDLSQDDKLFRAKIIIKQIHKLKKANSIEAKPFTAINKKGETLLGTAIRKKCIGVAQLLLQVGSDPLAVANLNDPEKKQDLLTYAIRSKNLNAVNLTLAKTRLNLNEKKKIGYTPVKLAIALSEPEIVASLWKEGATLDEDDVDWLFARMIKKQNFKITNALLDANIKPKDKSFIFWLDYMTNPLINADFIKNIKNIENTTTYSQCYASLWINAISEFNPDILRLMFEFGLSISPQILAQSNAAQNFPTLTYLLDTLKESISLEQYYILFRKAIAGNCFESAKLLLNLCHKNLGETLQFSPEDNLVNLAVTAKDPEILILLLPLINKSISLSRVFELTCIAISQNHAENTKTLLTINNDRTILQAGFNLVGRNPKIILTLLEHFSLLKHPPLLDKDFHSLLRSFDQRDPVVFACIKILHSIFPFSDSHLYPEEKSRDLPTLEYKEEKTVPIRGIDTTKHFKIWFNKNREEWMPLPNRLRLIRHRETNPQHTLSLVGANRYLSSKAINDRQKFCRKFKIIYIDIDTDLPQLIQAQNKDQQERDNKLLQIANDQLNHFFKPTIPGEEKKVV